MPTGGVVPTLVESLSANMKMTSATVLISVLLSTSITWMVPTANANPEVCGFPTHANIPYTVTCLGDSAKSVIGTVENGTNDLGNFVAHTADCTFGNPPPKDC